MKKVMPKRILCCMLVALLIVSVLPQTFAAEQTQWRAAMAKADITPTEACYLVGYYDNTAQSYWEPGDPATDLAARILILDSGADSERMVFLNLEMIASDAQYFTLQISQNLLSQIKTACHLSSTDNIILSNTHNHQAPYRLTDSADPSSLSAYEQNILDACCAAYANLQPVKIGIDTVETDYGVSRGADYGVADDQPYDAQMIVMRLDAMDGTPIGMIYDAAIHNTALSAYNKDNAYYLNCEFCGYASRYLETQVGGVAMFINGFYGNAGPNLRGSNAVTASGKIGVGQLQYWGEEFGKEILAVYNGISTSAQGGDLRTNLYFDSLPNNMSNTTYADARGQSSLWMQTKIAQLGENIAFLGVDFEPFSIIGAKLRAESPYETLLLAGNVNGLRGYIPTDTAFSYGNWAECQDDKTPFEAGIADIFYEKLIHQLCDFKGVAIERSSAAMTSEDNVYTFTFAQPVIADKLVLDFGDVLRTNCASDFTIAVYGVDGALLETKQVSDFSSGYYGYFVKSSKPVLCVVMTAQSRYSNYWQTSSSNLDKIDVSMYAVHYADLHDLGTENQLADFWKSITDTKEGAIEASFALDTDLSASKVLLHGAFQSNQNSVICTHEVTADDDATYCFSQHLLDNLHVEFTEGEDYADFIFTQDYRNWSQECVYLTVKPTEKAIEDAVTAPSHQLRVSGKFYYQSQDGAHQSVTDYPFCFTMQAEENLLVDGKTGKIFTTVEEALSKQQTFSLSQSYTSAADILIAPGCTVDLNGFCLNLGAHTLTNAGRIIDSTDGNGLVILSQQNGVAFTNAGMLPLYDQSAGGYRLFAYSLITEKADKVLTNDKLHVAFQLKLTGANCKKGYQLIAANSCLNIGICATYAFTDDHVEQTKRFFYEDYYLKTFAKRMLSAEEEIFVIFHSTLVSDKVEPGMEARANVVSYYTNGACNGFDLFGALRTNVEQTIEGETGVDVEPEE